ncbi:MAG: DUF11 domain-containing protein [Kosmotoga sp.]|nr:MAG: DUF11 domain-containing protein [Kosmotoga sp.]
MKRIVPFLFLLLFFELILVAQMPATNIIIKNYAVADFEDMNGKRQTIISNVVTTNILPYPNFEIYPDGTVENPGQLRYATPGEKINLYYELENTGNIEIDVDLSYKQLCGSSAYVYGIFLDLNQNGRIDNDEKPIKDPARIEKGEIINLIMSVRIPIQSKQGETFCFDLVGMYKKENILDEENISKIEVSDNFSVRTYKSANTRSINPGEEINFRINIDNYSESQLNNVEVLEYVDYNGLSNDGIFVKGSLESSELFSVEWFDGKEWTDKFPENAREIKGFKVKFEEINALQSVWIDFKLYFPPDCVSGIRVNQAKIKYTFEDNEHDQKTNKVNYLIEGKSDPWIGPLGKPMVEELGDNDITIISEAVSNEKVVFNNTVKNAGNEATVIDLMLVETNFDSDGWSYYFGDALGSPLIDINDNGTVDAGILEPGKERDITLVVIPPKEIMGNNQGKNWRFKIKAFSGNKENYTIDELKYISTEVPLSMEKEIISSKAVSANESIEFELKLTNHSSITFEDVIISDTIDSLLGDPFNIEISKNDAVYAYNSDLRQLKIMFEKIDALEEVTITFSATVNNEVVEGSEINNIASVRAKYESGQIIEESNEVTALVVEKDIELSKTATPSKVKVGDRIHYTIKVTNPSSIASLTNIVIEDTIPAGTEYVKDSALVNSEKTTAVYDDGKLYFKELPSIKPGETIIVEYDLLLVRYSDKTLTNSVLLKGDLVTEVNIEKPVSITTDEITVETEVEVVYNTESSIFGRVYIDENNNGYVDSEDVGVENIKLFLEDGHFVVTDENGYYHFSDVKGGQHIIKIDIDNTSYMLESSKDYRTLGNDRSYSIWVTPGLYSELNIQLYKHKLSNEIINYHNPQNLQGLKARSVIVTQNSNGAIKENNGLSAITGFVFPDNEEIFTGKDSIRVKIAVQENTNHELFVNDARISEGKIGVISEDVERDIKYYEYYNIRLQKGWNYLRLSWENNISSGEEIIKVYLSGEAEDLKVSVYPEKIFADGITTPEVIIQLVDEEGYQSSISGTVEVSGLERERIIGDETEKGKIFVEITNGVGKLSLKPSTIPKDYYLTVSFNNMSKNINVTYKPEERPSIISGFVEGSYNFSSKEFNFEGSGFGRVPYGKGMLTVRYSNPSINSESTSYDYSFGDYSKMSDLTPSEKTLYLRYDQGMFNVQLGDYSFDAPEEIPVNISRNGFGLSSEYYSKKFNYKIFVEPNNYKTISESIPGKGIRGIYKLTNNDIVRNSETILLVVKNEEGKTLRSELQKRGVDYEINYQSGSLIFESPVPRFNDDFNLVYINIVYSVKIEIESNLSIMAFTRVSDDDYDMYLQGYTDGLNSDGSKLIMGGITNKIENKHKIEIHGGISQWGEQTGGILSLGLNFKGDSLSGDFAAKFTNSFKVPGESDIKSELSLKVDLKPIKKNFEMQFEYNNNFKENISKYGASFINHKNYKHGDLSYSTKLTLLNENGKLNTELTSTINPSFSLNNTNLSGELYIGLRNYDLTGGVSGRLTTKLATNLDFGIELQLDYDGFSKKSSWEITESTFLKKSFGKTAIILKNKTDVLPELSTEYSLGLSYTQLYSDFSLYLNKEEGYSLLGNYEQRMVIKPFELNFLIEGEHSLTGSPTEDSNSVHIGIKEFENENLTSRFDLDVLFGSSLKVKSILLEGLFSYFDRDKKFYPWARVRYISEVEIDTETVDISAGTGLKPVSSSNFVIFSRANYFFARENEVRNWEGSLYIDWVSYKQQTLHISNSLDVYFKPDNIYMAAGFSMQKSYFDVLNLSGTFYMIADKELEEYFRLHLEASYNLSNDTELFVGYGFGSLDESFYGRLGKNGLYTGIRFKIDDSWFSKPDEKGKLIINFFKDVNVNKNREDFEEGIRISFSVDGTLYHTNDNGVFSEELEPGTYKVKLENIPEDLLSCYETEIKINVEKNKTRNFEWAFVEKPSYIKVKVFEDVNANGEKDENENFVDDFFSSVENITLASTDGAIVLPVEPGEHIISLDIQSFGDSVSLTTGTLSNKITTLPGKEYEILFGIYFNTSLKVIVFNDTNADGIKQQEEKTADLPITLSIAGKPYSIYGEGEIKGIPTGKNKINYGFKQIDAKRLVFTNDKKYINTLKEKEIFIGIAKKPELSICFYIDENNNGIKDENENLFDKSILLRLGDIELEVIEQVEFFGLKPGLHSLRVIEVPDNYIINSKNFEIELKPNEKKPICIPIYEKKN